MGWMWLTLIGVVAFALLWRAGVTRGLAWFSAATLILAASGYAVQQHAGLPGHPVSANAVPIEIDPGLVAFREAILPGQPGDDRILATADTQLRNGDTEAAAQGLMTAIEQRPDDAALWTGYATALAAHDGGQVSPAAQFAFRRAVQLDPRAPGPPFFLGLAYIQAGELPAAKIAWLQALRLAPPDAPYRIDIAERLVMIDEFQAMSANNPPPM